MQRGKKCAEGFVYITASPVIGVVMKEWSGKSQNAE